MGAFRFLRRSIARFREFINPAKNKLEAFQEDAVSRKAAQHIRHRYLQKLGVGVRAKPTGSSMNNFTSRSGIEPDDESWNVVDGSISNGILQLCKTETDAAMPQKQGQHCTADQQPDTTMLGKSVQPCSGDQDEFRVRFLSKLSYRKVWLPTVQRPPKSQAILIFDWDDTLVCTTWLHSYCSRMTMPSVLNSLLAQIAWEVTFLLRQACQLGRTFIITNAVAGWVEASAEQWLPEVLPMLHQISIISARSQFQHWYPEIHQWKVQAFLKLQGQLDLESVTNVVAVGDAEYEMDAAHALGKQCTRATVKTIRFEASPSPQDLLKQLVLLRKQFPGIVESGHDVDLWMNRRTTSCA